jgi:hypothetical protein
MTIPDDEGPRREGTGQRTQDRGTVSFASWLDVLAPVYARLYLREGSPIWNAIFDLRAAMILDSWGDSSSDDWAHEQGIRWRAPRTLESCGILLPEAVFNRVRRIHEDSQGTLGRNAHDLWQADADAEGDCWARWRLLDAARDALSYGPETACRRRYGCDPDAEMMR